VAGLDSSRGEEPDGHEIQHQTGLWNDTLRTGGWDVSARRVPVGIAARWTAQHGARTTRSPPARGARTPSRRGGAGGR